MIIVVGQLMRNSFSLREFSNKLVTKIVISYRRRQLNQTNHWEEEGSKKKIVFTYGQKCRLRKLRKCKRTNNESACKRIRANGRERDASCNRFGARPQCCRPTCSPSHTISFCFDACIQLALHLRNVARFLFGNVLGQHSVRVYQRCRDCTHCRP